jgi:pimeloyl-ACP methyl ester carboxylesterase
VATFGSRAPGTVAWLRRWRWWAGGAVAALLALLVGAAASWHFSSAVLVPDHHSWPEDVRVEALPAGEIVLSRSQETERPGVYGVVWQAGHGVLGAVRSEDDDTVTRRLRDVRGYLAPEMKVAIDSQVYAGDPGQALGLPFADVRIAGELGKMPAWFVPGRSDTWAIVVHGINDNPEVGLRILPALRRAGLPSLSITYREDLGAPPSPDSMHHMGLTEWQDLAAAAHYALSHGARQMILIGYSMGGSLVTQFMQHSPLAPRVAGLVLDAPALDWQEILSFNATEMGMPGFMAWPVEWAIGARIDADWESLDAVEHRDDFQLPILLFHGEDDEVIPISTSDEFAAELPRWVTYFRLPKAGHTEAWNVDPRLYERRLRSFLGRIEPAPTSP